MDPATLNEVFGKLMLNALQQFTGWLTDQADGGAMVVMQQIIALIRGLDFVTRTDTKLVNSLTTLIGLNQVLPLADAMLQSGLLLGAVAYAGHYYFGWRPIGDSFQRVFVATLLTRLSLQLMDWTLQVMDGMTTGIAANIPDFPTISNLNPVVLVVLMLVWLILLFQLVLVSAERIAWLVVLKPLAPLAFMLWVTPQSAWVASKYIQLWVGWLAGQFFVILAVAAMELMVNQGGIEGYFLSCACLMVARKAISMLAPTGGESLVKVGPLKI